MSFTKIFKPYTYARNNYGKEEKNREESNQKEN